MIEVEGLSRRYGETMAVDSLSFTAEDGLVTGFVGPNGAGKSTTLRILLGLERADGGGAHIDGHSYGALDRPMSRVGALLDAGWVHPGRSARAHLRWLSQVGRIDADRVGAVLTRVGLDGVADRRVGGFSLGMRQRLGLAGALLGEPAHLVLDEPLNGLDPDGVHWMRRFIRHYAECGNTVLVSSHLLSEMSLTADRLVVIGRGSLIGQYDTDEFVRSMSATSIRVRVDRPEVLCAAASARGWAVETTAPGALALSDPAGGLDAPSVGQVCFAAGLRVDELTEVRGSLEDAFLAATGDALDYGSPEAGSVIVAPPAGVRTGAAG
ncbi:ATP-binding cassette domain-containing protein [Tomitella cavernea]|nr:ATP-binding cassette domain-containing protein [Tomitella cavernea]